MARFEEIDDISFMGNINLAGLKKTAVEAYSAAYSEITGKDAYIGDEHKAVLYALAQIVYQSAAAVNEKAKQNLLKYAGGAYLDNLALSQGLLRKKEEHAVVTVRFSLSAIRGSTVAIPQGTRVTDAANKIYFAAEYAEIPQGRKYADVKCVSVTGGAETNNFEIGDLKILADPIAYISSVSNIDIPSGGADEESDDAFAQRIFEAKNIFSTAGSENAYIYYTKAYSTLIDDVVVTNPRDAEIDIYILMKDRNGASGVFIDSLTEYLCSDDIRPLTDKITVKNAERAEYVIDAEYTVYKSDIQKISEKQAAVLAAAEEYKTWQCAKIGRDINPQKLISLMIAAGAANVNIITPERAEITETQIAVCTGMNIKYKGYSEE